MRHRLYNISIYTSICTVCLHNECIYLLNCIYMYVLIGPTYLPHNLFPLFSLFSAPRTIYSPSVSLIPSQPLVFFPPTMSLLSCMHHSHAVLSLRLFLARSLPSSLSLSFHFSHPSHMSNGNIVHV